MSKNDNITVCTRCNHKWKPRIERTPKYCPSCKSPYWNKPKKRVSKELVLLLKDGITELHNAIIKSSGGELGIRDDAGLYHSLYAALNYQAHHMNDPPSIGAFIYNEFAKKHHFWDGNKRTAHVFAKMWLLGMNYHLMLDYKEAVGFILEIAKHESPLSLEDIRKWLEENCTRIEQKDVDSYLKLPYFDIIEGTGEQHGK